MLANFVNMKTPYDIRYKNKIYKNVKNMVRKKMQKIDIKPPSEQLENRQSRIDFLCMKLKQYHALFLRYFKTSNLIAIY